MGFESPLWLLGLIPWGALVIYLLPGKGRPAVVPFLGLWRGSGVPSRWMARRWPPTGVLLAMSALLLTILAAGQPYLATNRVIEDDITIVLDRGATMSLPSASGKPFRNVTGICASAFPFLSTAAQLKLVPTPGRQIDTRGDTWQAVADALSPTGIATGLDQVVSNELKQTRGPIFVLSDQALNVKASRVVQIFPEAAAPSVAITSIGARLLPHPQVMLRIENHSDLSMVEITVESDDAVSHQQIALPARNQNVDRFIDLPKLGKTIRAAVDSAGAQGPWSQAFLIRQSNGIHIAVDSTLNESVRRMVKVYSANRPAQTDATTVAVSNRELPADESGIWIGVSSNTPAAPDTCTTTPHAITQHVKQWFAGDALKSPVGFNPLVACGNVPIVAVRDDSVRQIWLNANLDEWEKTPDFVIFFANAFDWISRNSQSYRSSAPGHLGEQWKAVTGAKMPSGAAAGEWPGIYQSSENRMIAVNAGAFPKLNVRVDRSSTDRNLFRQIAGHRLISSSLIFAALIFLLFAAIAW